VATRARAELTAPIPRTAGAGLAPPTGRCYAAFLSYRREPDGRLAVALQRELERFAKPWHLRRALRVFRDDTNLAANPDLWHAIVTALDSSDIFILLASPEAARSEWVDREAAHWLAHRPPASVLLGVTAGELVWTGSGFDRAATTCLPPALLAAFTTEPRWVDLRGLRDRPRLDLSVLPFREAVVDLAAPLRGWPRTSWSARTCTSSAGRGGWSRW
jgi:hypothetical protein